MAETQPDGLDTLRARLERRPRSIPPARHQRAANDIQDEDSAGAEKPSPAEDPAPEGARPAPERLRSRPSSPPRSAALDAPSAAITGEPLANLVLRPRRSLDYRLADLVHDLRREGVKTSKVELVELLLWELPPKPTAELRERLAKFRRTAPREPLL